MLGTEEAEENIDYRKLLKMCMASWLESEDCLWDGWSYDSKTLQCKVAIISPKEVVAIKEIALEILKDEEEENKATIFEITREIEKLKQLK